MSDTTKQKLLSLLYSAFKPLAHLLIESGVGHREFSEVLKRAYVDVASKNYGIRGRDTNISRVAVMTGLTRKEVKRVRDELSGATKQGPVKQLPPSVILQHWYSDPDFQGENGEPAPLNFSEEAPSFPELARRYAGDIPAGALRTELLRAGAIEVDDDEKLIALRRTYRLVDANEQFMWALSRTVYASLSNACHNFFVRRYPGRSKQAPWPARVVDVNAIEAVDLQTARDIVAREATSFTEKVDDALIELSRSKTEEAAEARKATGRSVMVGVVYMEQDETA